MFVGYGDDDNVDGEIGKAKKFIKDFIFLLQYIPMILPCPKIVSKIN
jgi:hypothetical protein